MILVDKRCNRCGYKIEYVDNSIEEYCPYCKTKLERMFGFRKPKEFIPGFYEHFEKKPIYIESRQQYRRECEKRGLVQSFGPGSYDSLYSKRKSHVDLNLPKKKKRDNKKLAEQAVSKAYKQLGME